MDNLTHSLVGLAAARRGWRIVSRRNYSCVLAANAPDADMFVLAFGDRWTFLQHHRGITHAIVGVICLAVLLPLIFYAVTVSGRGSKSTPKTKLKGLLIARLLQARRIRSWIGPTTTEFVSSYPGARSGPTAILFSSSIHTCG
jgi:inner membrane protein